MKFICPLIIVEDMSVARDFYESFLGIKVIQDHGENVVFEGPFSLHLRSHFSELINRQPIIAGSNASELYFETDDVDVLAERLQVRNIEFVHPVREQPWRQKVVRFYDPDDNLIEAGETMENCARRLAAEGLSVEQIGKTLAMESERIKTILSGKQIE
jgi:catechol 2,3-dioxygenase-like lactoylglutathione lyase family enzyme